MTTRLPRPLEGLRILDLTVALAGPYGTLLLGGLGAEVIRVESPEGSDLGRTNPPFVGADGIHFVKQADDDLSLTFLNRARNKKNITLNLKSEQGREMFMALAKTCDVVMENMSDGTAKRLGVDYESVRKANPSIIYASINSLGDPSAIPGLKGMDIIVQAYSGMMAVTGFADGPPTRVGVPIADLIAPLFAVNGILSAVIYRSKTGEGQHVQVSMLDCMASWVAEEHFDVMADAGFPMRTGNSTDRIAPFGVFATKNGHVAIAAAQPAATKELFEAMGHAEMLDDPRFNSRGARAKNVAEMNARIEAWTRTLTNDEVMRELFEKRGVPTAPVRTPQEMLKDPMLHASGAIVNLKHPVHGDIGKVGTGLPIRFSKCAADFDVPATDTGTANEQVYGELLNLSKAQLVELRDAGVI
ncbi:CaiB/BaiF CoA transferase family protein [Ramlibacter sp.]|uniref:CaiB/BaiF CoA transferase family protein n=1 Tax=Ramlibacter sp. TaxID=1917967 RepID=UPI003D14C1BE